MDEVHPAGSVVSEAVFNRSLLKPLYAFPDGLLPIHVCLLWSMRTIPLQFRWLSTT